VPNLLPIKGCHNLAGVSFDLPTFYLLNLGLKFVPTPTCLPGAGLEAALDRFSRSFRLRCQFGSGGPAPKHVLPNRAYAPKEAPPLVEDFLWALEEAVSARHAAASRILLRRLRRNLSSEEYQALVNLQQRQDLVIKPADKNLGLTIMRVADYRESVRQHVLDPQVYSPVADIAAAIRTTCKQLVQLVDKYPSSLEESVRRYVLAGLSMKQVPYLYGLPKLHKMAAMAPPIITRPIAACHSWITTNLSKYVADLLDGALRDKQRFPTVLRDRTQLVAAVEQCSVTDETWLLTFDVESLYPSIDQQQCAEACAEAVRGTQQARAMVYEFVLFILRNNIVQVEGQYYRQIQGGAMGTNCLPQAAQLYLAVKWEGPIRRRLGDAFPAVYQRFIDDGFVVFNGSRAQLLEFVACLQSELHNIRITYSFSRVQVEFMDLVVYKSGPAGVDKQTLRVRTHQKPLNRYLYIPWHSFHHPGMFRSFIHAELIRYVITNSDVVWYDCMVQKFTHRLRERGYPSASIQQLVSKVSFADRAKYIAAAVDNSKYAQQGSGEVLPLVVPYARDIAVMQLPSLLRQVVMQSPGVVSKLRALNTRALVCFSRTRNLGSKLVRAGA
jgi:hypothetical protein